MERFAAMVSSRRGAPAPPLAATEEVEVKKKKEEEEEAYLSIKLEEIIIVKNEDIGNPCAGAHAGNSLGFGVACNHASSTFPSIEQCATAAKAQPVGATRGAWMTVAKIIGFE